MMDRGQHLKMFLTGLGDSQEDARTVVTDAHVRKQLDRHPIKAYRLLKAIRHVSHFEFSPAQENEFVWLFGRYR